MFHSLSYFHLFFLWDCFLAQLLNLKCEEWQFQESAIERLQSGSLASSAITAAVDVYLPHTICDSFSESMVLGEWQNCLERCGLSLEWPLVEHGLPPAMRPILRLSRRDKDVSSIAASLSDSSEAAKALEMPVIQIMPSNDILPSRRSFEGRRQLCRNGPVRSCSQRWHRGINDVWQ